MNFEFLKNPLIASIIAGAMASAFTYLDSKATGTPREKNTYIKISLATALIVGVIVHLVTGGTFSINMGRGGGGTGTISGGQYTEVLTGQPDF